MTTIFSYYADTPLTPVTKSFPQTPFEIDLRAKERYAHLMPNKELSYSHGYAYDAAWAIGVALNKSIEKLKPLNKKLEDFTYGDKAMLAVMRESLEETNFYGATVCTLGLVSDDTF
jgi:hypothetical protein